MFGTRAGLVEDLVFAVTLAAPVLTWRSIRLAKARSFERHRRFQVALLAVCVVAVLALEVRIRLAGGSGSLLATSAYGGQRLARVLLGLHIAGAVVTYALWGWLAVASWRRFRSKLPGAFTPRHRALGLGVFGGLVFSALSATGMYLVAFVL